jgi:PhnB protein
VTKLHLYLDFAGNAEEAFGFYKSVFGGEFSSLFRFKDLPVEGVTTPKGDEDKIMHISLPNRRRQRPDGERRPGVARPGVGGGQQRLRVGPPGQPGGGRQDLQCPFRGGEIEMPIADQVCGTTTEA